MVNCKEIARIGLIRYGLKLFAIRFIELWRTRFTSDISFKDKHTSILMAGRFSASNLQRNRYPGCYQ